MSPGQRFNGESLQRALDGISAGAWTPPSVHTATNGTHGYRVVSLVELGRRRPAADRFGFVLDEFEPVWSAWLSRIEPGGFIVRHIDAGPYHERWHVPISPAGEGLTGEAGVAFPVRHWEPHAVTNPTQRPRIHIVLDRERIVDNRAVTYQQC